MSVPEKINDFLLARLKRAYCDGCIQERLGLKWRQQVQLVTSTLAVTPHFERQVGACCQCNEEKQVVRAIELPRYRLTAQQTVISFPKVMRFKTSASLRPDHAARPKRKPELRNGLFGTFPNHRLGFIGG